MSTTCYSHRHDCSTGAHMTQHIEEARKLEPVAWGAWSDFEQKVIAATTDKMKADTYDGQGDISIHPLVRISDAQTAIAAAEERGRREERESTGWLKVPKEPPLELLKSVNVNNQVLAYENGRYYNAWFAFDEFDGEWFWTDDADSEPNPSHYRKLGEPPAITKEPTP